MSDLSDVLGDLYGETNPDGPHVKREATADARVAAAALANGAQPVDEGETLETLAPQLGPQEDHLAMALSAALASLPIEAETPASSTAVAAAEQWAESLEAKERGLELPRKWQRSDDDILPSNFGKKKRKG